MEFEISPEPSEDERAAILAALADESEREAVSPWEQALLEPEEP
jgi:hypothetical protein